MNTYETTATVEDHGQIHVAGVPFQPGTRVEVTITPAETAAHRPRADRERATELLAALDKSRNTETVGPLRRAGLYDREMLR